MNGSANVRSLESIEAVRTALDLFRDQIEQSLAMIDIEMRRVLDWLEHDRPRHWRSQVRIARDGVTTARANLHRCLMYPIADERPSCREERAALKQAEAKLAYCEEKAERLKHWIREVRHEMFEYDGRISQLTELVEYDVPKAVAILNQLMLRLEEYQSVRPASAREVDSSPPPPTGQSLADQLWPDHHAEQSGPAAQRRDVPGAKTPEAPSANDNP
jgi:hypothetical protein